MAAWGWLAAAILSCLIAVAQYLGWSALLAPLAAVTEPGEAFANLRQRNQFATLTSLGLVSLLFLRPRMNLASALVLSLLAIGNAASASRTGALQWVVVTLFTAAYTGQRRDGTLQSALFALTAYLAASMVMPLLFEVINGQPVQNVFSRMSEAPSCGSRLVLWSNVWELSLAHPWVGWGWGELDYAHFAHLYSPDRFCDILDNAHNLILHLAVELGWPVALAACVLAAWFVVKWGGRTAGHAIPRLGWAALIMLALHSLVEYPLWYGPFQMAAGLALGLIVFGSDQEETVPPRNVERIVLAVLAGIVVFWAQRDYHRISQLYVAPEERDPEYREETLAKVRASRLFREPVLFAELSITPLTRENAAYLHDLALRMLHYSPEPKVIAIVIDSALLLGRHDAAAWHMQRFKAAFPDDYGRWAREHGLPDTGG